MNRIIWKFAAGLLMFVNLLTYAAESEITILGVTTGGANSAFAETQLQYLKDNWGNFGGVSIKLVNDERSGALGEIKITLLPILTILPAQNSNRRR